MLRPFIFVRLEKNLAMESLEDLRSRVLASIAAAETLAVLDQARVAALGRKGDITERLKTLGQLDPDARRTAGAAINSVRDEIQAALEAASLHLANAELDRRLAEERIDVTLPVAWPAAGRIHPISQTVDEIAGIPCRGRSAYRGRFPQFHSVEYPTGSSGAAGARHLLSAGRCRGRPQGAAHSYLAGPDPDDDQREAADPHHLPRSDLSLRFRRDALADVSSG